MNQPLQIIDCLLDQWEEAIAETYRAMSPRTRASLLAQSVLNSDADSLRKELARMVSEDAKEWRTLQ
jgi:hypothetical protein